VIRSRKNLARFLAAQGLDALLDLLEVPPPCLNPSFTLVTRFATSPPTDNCPQPKEAQPLSA
jgi:hypothetical protein